MGRWIGVDFDETLRRWDGTPIELMVDRVKKWLAQGIEVRVVTARLCAYVQDQPFDGILDQRKFVQDWCEEHIGYRLEVQWGKGPGMIELWDDKVVRVEANTGRQMSLSLVEEDPRITAIKAHKTAEDLDTVKGGMK